MNFTLHEEKEEVLVRELVTQLEEVPNCPLDEWANAFQFDPIDEGNGTGLGTYCIHEENAPVPNLSKESNDI